MTLIIALIITPVSMLLAIGLMGWRSQNAKEIKNLQELICYAQRERDEMAENYTNEQQTTTRLLNQITRQNNELRHNREEISTLKNSIAGQTRFLKNLAEENTNLRDQVNTLKDKLRSCESKTIFQDI